MENIETEKKEQDAARKRGEKKVKQFVEGFEGVQDALDSHKQIITKLGDLIHDDLVPCLDELQDEIKTLRMAIVSGMGKKANEPPIDLNDIVFGKD